LPEGPLTPYITLNGPVTMPERSVRLWGIHQGPPAPQSSICARKSRASRACPTGRHLRGVSRFLILGALELEFCSGSVRGPHGAWPEANLGKRTLVNRRPRVGQFMDGRRMQ